MTDWVEHMKQKAASLTDIGNALKHAEERLERCPTEQNLMIVNKIRDLYLNGSVYDQHP